MIKNMSKKRVYYKFKNGKMIKRQDYIANLYLKHNLHVPPYF